MRIAFAALHDGRPLGLVNPQVPGHPLSRSVEMLKFATIHSTIYIYLLFCKYKKALLYFNSIFNKSNRPFVESC
jgi:hypothetical protein